jgi:hypothetical protein
MHAYVTVTSSKKGSRILVVTIKHTKAYWNKSDLKDNWIISHSDHSLLYFEVQKI